MAHLRRIALPALLVALVVLTAAGTAAAVTRASDTRFAGITATGVDSVLAGITATPVDSVLAGITSIPVDSVLAGIVATGID